MPVPLVTEISVFRSFDDDMLLVSALENTDLPVVRRVIAGIAVGTPVDDAYHALFDLHAAIQLAACDEAAGVSVDEETGRPVLEHILAQPSDDYLRALWFVVERCGFGDAASHLAWLLALLKARGHGARLARDAGRPVVHRPASPTSGPSDVEPVELFIGSAAPSFPPPRSA